MSGLAATWQYLTSTQGLPVLIITLLTLIWLLSSVNDKRPPFPWIRLPIIGNIISLSISKEKAYMLFYKTSKKPEYDKVFMIKVGGREFCVLNHVDSVKEALIQKAEHYANRVKFFSVMVAMNGGNDVLMQDYGPIWKLQRKVLHQSVRKFASGARLNSYVQKSTSQVIDLIKEQNKPFYIKPMLELLQFNTFTGILFGNEYNFDDPEFKKVNNLSKEGLEALGNGSVADIFPALTFCSSYFQEAKIKRLNEPFVDFIRCQLKEHKENFDAENPRDMTDYLLLSELELKDEGLLDNEAIANILLDVFGAGIDTINSVLMFAVANAMLNPDIQEKLFAETKRVIGERLPVHADRPNLPYTEAYLCEVLRHDTMTVLGIPLETTCDTTIGKYELPKGTGIVINFWALHNDPDYWENPSEFRPERFLDNSGEIAHRPDSFMPFGHGKRVCPGDNLAKAMLMIMLPMLFRNIKFTKPEGCEVECENTGLAHIAKRFEVIAELRE